MAHTKHVTLVAATVANVALDDPGQDAIYVTNRHATVEAFATVNGVNPTVGGDDTYLIPAGMRTAKILVPAGAVDLRLISSGTPAISASAFAPVYT